MLRIGYDAKRLFNNFTGLGNYSRTLVKDMATYFPDEAYFLFTPKITNNSETSYFLNSPMFEIKHYKGWFKAWWRTRGMAKDILNLDIDLYHGLSHEIPRGLKHKGVKSVVTIHDLVFKYYPEQYSPIDRIIYDEKFAHACENADKIIAISESTKRDIIKFYNTPEEKISVIYQSCGRHFFQEKSDEIKETTRKKYNIPNQYYLYVGSIIERKNLLGIVRAMAQIDKKKLLPLVVIGDGKAYKKKVVEFATRHRLMDYVLFRKIAYEDLPAVYQSAHLFIYPSFYEGFGIPVLEALLSETPVITSNVSSLPEVAGPDSYLVAPDDINGLSRAIVEVSSDESLRATMRSKGLKYAEKFKGDKLAAQHLLTYKSILGIP